ncbi:hypothetical protein PVAP13_8NG233900 [Panicum virgatum]|uniref:Uncharacterized protein n=1 Tax=Panicum virgatum TaxID=38727 RepID=A0A8T0PH57_PANVG|nr:hypothetical protein PVAP13_8NG233900 [Panicum virgatum]
MDTNIAWAESVLLNRPVGSMAAAHELFDRRSLVDVVWDEESEHIDESFLAMQEDAKETVDEMLPHEMMVWDEGVLSNATTHESLLRKLIMRTEDLIDEKLKLSVNIIDADQVFEEISDKVAMWDNDMLFYLNTQDGFLQHLALDAECMNEQNTKANVVWVVDEMLELKVVDGDKSNGNLWLGEHGAGLV